MLQIAQAGRFQAFDDTAPPSLLSSLLASATTLFSPAATDAEAAASADEAAAAGVGSKVAAPSLSRYWVSPAYDPRALRCPVGLFYGGADSVINVPALCALLPPGANVECVEHYEHLDMMWAADANTRVFQPILRWLLKCEGGGGRSYATAAAHGAVDG